MAVPQHLIDHCKSHPMCKRCPLNNASDCVAPQVPVTDPRWQEWIDSVAEKVLSLSENAIKTTQP